MHIGPQQVIDLYAAHVLAAAGETLASIRLMIEDSIWDMTEDAHELELTETH